MADVSASDLDRRGAVLPDQAAAFRATRVAEPWQRYDSIVIGEGAATLSKGWYNTWNDFANASQLGWFMGRDSNVGKSYCNQLSDRSDWAQDLITANVEFIAPTGLSEFFDNPLDASVTPFLFTQQLPTELPMSLKMSEADEVLVVPANHIPSGFALQGSVVDGSPGPVTVPGSQGTPHVTNNFIFAEPILLAAKSLLTVSARLDAQSQRTFSGLPGPGAMNIPIGGGLFLRQPLWYKIKFTFFGPRYLQMRGARTSA